MLQVQWERARAFQVATLKSSPFWLVCWSWKLLNPHSLMSFLLCLVFFDCAGRAFLWARYLGYIPIVVLGVFSELYMQSAMWGSIEGQQ